jgi:hypothetical protein
MSSRLWPGENDAARGFATEGRCAPVIICTACGVRNQDSESFCGECGSYLEWEGEREAAATEAVPVIAPEPPAEAPGLVRRIKTAVGIDTEGEQQFQPAGDAAAAAPGRSAPASGPGVAGYAPPLAGPAPPSGYAPPPAGPAAPGGYAPSPGYPPPSPGNASPPAPAAPPPGPAGPPAPVADSAPAPVLPGAAAPKPRHRELPPEDRKPAPGETICGNCGAGNVPTRKFCRRCGTELLDAPVVPNAPWWRRILRSRGSRDPVAGTRPTHQARRSHRGLIAAAVVIVLLVAAGWLTRAQLSRAYNSVLDRVQGTKIVNPTSFRASGSASGHDVAKARDGAPNLYWAPAALARPQGQWLQMGFTSGYRLVYLRVFSGASDQLADYLKQASPHVLRLTILRTGGKRSTKDITLEDKPGAQSVHLAIDDVVAVRLTIESVYRPAPGKLVAIGEVEFLGRT